MENNYFYTVFEEWMDKQGNVGTQGFVFLPEQSEIPAQNRAAGHYHAILATAAVADDLYHAAICIRSDGWIEKPLEAYDRRPREEKGEN